MDLKKHTVEKLKEICLNYHLPTVGRKGDLIKRITEYVNKQKAMFDESKSEPAAVQPVRNQTYDLYIKMKSANLFHYYNSGIIYPLALETNDIYKRENRKQDFFNLNQEYIPLLKSAIDEFNDDEVYIEVNSKNLDLEQAQEYPSLFFCPEPIPVSRVNRLYFKTASSRSSFLSSANTFPDFFIPQEICSVGDFNTDSPIAEISTPGLQPNVYLKKWSSKLQTYDKIMGLFCFMKNSGIFFAERTDQYQEYSPTFFQTLLLLNDKIDIPHKENNLLRPLLFPLELDLSNGQRILFRQILDKVYSNAEFSFQLAEEMLETTLSTKTVTTEEARDFTAALSYFKKLQNHQIAFSEVFRFEGIRRNLPLLALTVLSRYPNKSRQHTDKQAARLLFINNEFGFSKSIAEFLLAILGMYYGYQTMVKSDTNLKLNDPYFAAFANKQQQIKFKLHTRLEKVIVETIYYWCRDAVTQSSDFEYLESYAPREAKSPYNSVQVAQFKYFDKPIIVLGTQITIIERASQYQQILEKLEQCYSPNISAKSLLLMYVIQNIGVSKSLLIELIKANLQKLDVPTISTLIDLDNKK